MTSAPKSAMAVVATGPAMKLAASMTRMPSRRRGSAPMAREYSRRVASRHAEVEHAEDHLGAPRRRSAQPHPRHVALGADSEAGEIAHGGRVRRRESGATRWTPGDRRHQSQQRQPGGGIPRDGRAPAPRARDVEASDLTAAPG